MKAIQLLKILTITLLLGSLHALTSCSDNNDDEKQGYLTVSTTSAEIGCDGETFLINVSSNSEWNVASNASWLTVRPGRQAGTGNVEISVSPNDGRVREAEINFYIKDEKTPSATITVRQLELGEHSLSVSPMVVALENGNLESEVLISETIHKWTFEIVEGGEWMEVSKSDGNLKIEADALKVPYRIGLINILYAGRTYPVNVVQGDFREVAADNINVGYYGQLNEMPFTTSLVSVVGEKYASPFVGEDYQDYVMIQLNTAPITEYDDFRLPEGKFSFKLEHDSGDSYCSAGFFDHSMGVYGSCWLRKQFYMGEDKGFTGLFIFIEGATFISLNNPERPNIYIVASGLDQTFAKQTYVMKISGTVSYQDMTTRGVQKEVSKMSLKQQ